MGKKSEGFIVFMVVIILVTIFAATGIKVYQSHLDSEYKVIEKKICERARECYLDGKCNGESIILADLIENKYIEPQVNPKTKEYISEYIKIYYKDNSCVVNVR